jgi:hypothetical protein
MNRSGYPPDFTPTPDCKELKSIRQWRDTDSKSGSLKNVEQSKERLEKMINEKGG